MKQKQSNDHTLHQRVEHIFAHKFCVMAVIGFLGLAIMHKTDSRVFLVMRAAYAQGFGKVGEYMREEPMRTHFVLNVSRDPTISGR